MDKIENLRNIAIIAHVDHGKTTLVDQMLKQSQTLDARTQLEERAMDSNDQERERGITILAKPTAIRWNQYRINIVDTPGHADFGGEVERVLSMVDSVLLLVDSVDGPMPQTRFVTEKALRRGLHPIVVINKIDRPSARPEWVLDQTFDLFDRLGATNEQLDFPVVYASGLNGFAGLDSSIRSGNLDPLFQTIIDKVHPPQVEIEDPFQLQVSQLDYNSYVGVIGIGRIARGRIKRNTPVVVVDKKGNRRKERVLQILGFLGLQRIEVDEAQAGDIVCFTGIADLNISDTLCDPDAVEALAPLSVDEPTVSMTFQVNNSPFAGKDGKFVTSRQIRERLEQELIHNVALRVDDTGDPDKFRVSGRGELHLSVLIENMRREGYELGVSRPEVITRMVDGEKHEPFEQLTVDVEDHHQGTIMERLGERGAMMQNMQPDGKGRVRLDFIIPSRGLIGFRTEFLTATQGTGLMFSVFDHYGPAKVGNFGQRKNGVLICNAPGKALTNALFNLQERGRMFLSHGDEVYEGMLAGIHSRDNDLVVNVLKAKQLTNVRAAGTDEAQILTPPIKHTLEQALEFIDDDELVEVTPNHIRLRKKILSESDRKRASRSKE
ncbi:MAG: translational GTPase TypA [Gammaproteobacteria bacterium]|nr:translational GTPase TypA [Gammaproteobacteria bacterium]